MRTRSYQRSEVLSYYDLTDEQQKEAMDYDDNAQEDSFVLWESYPLSLSAFMRIDNSLFHGVYSMTAFSAYLVRLSNCGTMATVVYQYS